MDITDTKAHIEGLSKKLADLRTDQGKFLGAQSIDTQIAKSQKEINVNKVTLELVKSELAELKAKKSDSLKFTIISMEEKISEMLPTGTAVIKIEDNSMSIGWHLMPDDRVVAYESLSGGQKKIFEQALTRAMLDKGGLLIYEAAEVDSDNLKALMKAIKGKPYQVILNTWKRPVAMKDWTITAR